MIFVTVGNMDPFDRLVRAVDIWVSQDRGDEEILVQIGNGSYHPKHCEYVKFLKPAEFREHFERARFVVSHAGMGTIISAMELGKPLIVMPKRADLGEQRNDHQLATVRRFRRCSYIHVAETGDELNDLLHRMCSANPPVTERQVELEHWPADSRLVDFVSDFIRGTNVRSAS